VPQCAQLAETFLQRLEVREVQGEQMDFAVIVERAELGSRNNSHAESLPRRPCGRDSIDCVVIRERQGGEPTARSGFDHSFRGESTVRRSRVSVQVDESRPARIRAHCS